MNALHRTALSLFLAGALALGGCAPAAAPPADETAVTAEVEALLDRWIAAFASGKAGELRALYVADGFQWIEDGELRYDSVDAVVKRVEAMPPGLELKTTLADTRVTVLSADHAAATTGFATTMVLGPQQTVQFDGVMTLLTERTGDGWRIREGHTSTRRQNLPRGSE